MPFRVEYWSPLCVFAIASTMLYIRLLYLIYKKRKTQKYNTFFYKMFFIGGLFDILSAVWYILANFTYVDQLFGSILLLNMNLYNLPNLCYYYIYYFLYAQIFTIILVSINRMIAIHCPLSNLLTRCDRIPLELLFLCTLVFPLLITIHFFFQPAIEFQLNAAGTAVVRWVNPDSTKANAIHAMCVVVPSTIFCALCYVSVLRKLAHLNKTHRDDRAHSRKWRQELSITIVGFATFIALCLATVYFSASYVAVMNNDQVLLGTMRSLNIIHYFAMAFVNPWALLIVNATMRKRFTTPKYLDMAFRTAYWIPLGIFTVTSSVLYVRMLILIFKKRNTQQYSSFFYKMFFIGGLLDLLSVFWYIAAQLIYVDQIFGSQFLLDISHDSIPDLFYYYVFYFLFAQIFIITLVSANRLCVIHYPTSRILSSCDRFPTIVLMLATLLFSFIIAIHYCWQPSVEFRLFEGKVIRWVWFSSTTQNAIHAICTVSVFNMFSAICYVLVIRKLMMLNRDKSSDLATSRKWKREIALTIVGFSTFVALCLVTCYFAVTQYAVATHNDALLASTREMNIVHYFAMTFVNPWMLLITNGSMRKSIFNDQSSVASGGKNAAQSASSRQIASVFPVIN